MPGKIPENILDEISRRTSIADVVGSYVNLKRSGGRWWGLCPFHNEKTPSFSVQEDQNLFYCFGCQKGGSVYSFLMEIESLTFVEAAGRLAEKAGVEIYQEEGQQEKVTNRRTLEDLYKRVSHTFRWLLLNRPEAARAREYLSGRGISPETAEHYRLGWAPAFGEWLYHFLRKKNYSEELLADSGLFSRKSPRWSYFVDRIMFPVMPDSERVTAFSGRALSDRGPKYINSPETLLYRKSRSLYGLGQAKAAIRKSGRVVICEGNLDVLSCMQAGIGETVAPLGTAFTEEQAAVLRRMTSLLVLAFDGDGAGQSATRKAAVIAERAGLSVSSVKLPSGSDPSDIFVKEGAATLKKIIQGPINIFSYLLDSLTGAQTVVSGEIQEASLEELTPYLDSVGSDVRREAYLKELADAVNADPVTVIREYRNRRKIKPQRQEQPGSVFKAPTDELFLMTAAAVKTEYFTVLKKALTPENFRDERALTLYRVLDELSTEGSVPRTDSVVNRLSDDKLKSYIVETAATGVYDEHTDKTISEKILLLKERIISEERQELLKGLSRPEKQEIREARLKRIQELGQIIENLRKSAEPG